jgi:hypothetical protein
VRTVLVVALASTLVPAIRAARMSTVIVNDKRKLTNIGAHLGIPDETIARLTNHKVQSQTGRYIDPDKVTQSPRQATETISAAIMKEIKL